MVICLKKEINCLSGCKKGMCVYLYIYPWIHIAVTLRNTRKENKQKLFQVICTIYTL